MGLKRLANKRGDAEEGPGLGPSSIRFGSGLRCQIPSDNPATSSTPLPPRLPAKPAEP
jgi:hypothetical protein